MLKVEAQAGTFMNIQKSQAVAYAELMDSLDLSDRDLIDYMQVQLIKNYPSGKLVISIGADGSRTAKPIKWAATYYYS